MNREKQQILTCEKAASRECVAIMSIKNLKKRMN